MIQCFELQVFSQVLCNYRISGNCYGLSNAPRTWFLKVKEALLENNFVSHSFDKCLFYHTNPTSNQPDCILIVHVDDFMAAYSEEFNLSILENLFEWGSVPRIDENTSGVYRGKEITMIKHPDGRIHFKVTQQAFLKNLDEGSLDRGRLKEDALVTAEETKEFRSASGCLQWLGGQGPPELASTASLCNKGIETRTSDLKKLHEAIEYAKETSDSGLVFYDVPLNKASCIVTYTTAAGQMQPTTRLN